MNVKQHIRMTASEIAMGRYMRAPDHPSGDDFSAAFAEAALEDAAATAAEGKTSGAETASGDAPAADASGEGAGAADAPAADGAAAPAAGADAGAADAGAADAAAAGEAAVAAPGADKGGDAPAADAGKGAAGGAGADAGAAAAAPAAAADGEDILKRLAAEVAKQAPAAAPAEEKPAAAAEAPAVFSDEEQGKLTKFAEDWPDIAEAVTLRSRELGQGVVQYVFDQIAPEVKQIRDLVQTLALRAHVGDLGELIGDYSNDEVDQIKEWVKTQPTYLQPAYLNVIEQGTAEEVSDLVNRYREVTGKKPAVAPGAETGASGGDTELSGAAKQAAAALAPVGSKRSVVPDANDQSSFDAGWAQFADKV